MYFITVKFNKYGDFFESSIKEIEFIKESDNHYLFDKEDEEIPVYLRSEIVYKDDSEDVLSCGYNVLNNCYVSFDLTEGFCYCICLDVELGKSLLKESIERFLLNKIKNYNYILEKATKSLDDLI